MEMDTGRQPKRRLFGSVRQSLRAQIGLIVLLSYLIPVVLLGVFTGGFLMKKLENQTRAAITSGAEQAWTLTEQKIERTLELARDAIYDGELMDSWQKWNDGSVYLSRDSQMEEYLGKGASIYLEENDVETLIATPTEGFLIERPTFPETQSAAGPASNEYAVAGRILLGLED